MKRKIIEIDDTKCNGCGVCIPNCPEGALLIIDGKARLVSDLFCDGLGACIGECPQGAIKTIEREAMPYDERQVMANIVKQGENTILAHLEHLKSHGEDSLYQIAIDYLIEHSIAIPTAKVAPIKPAGCMGMLAKSMAKPAKKNFASGDSALGQWPIQLSLLNPAAAYFDDANLLISADCVAHAYGAFHQELLANKILAIFCPKLDSNLDEYIEKLAEIFKSHNIKSITIARMEVPCCGGTVAVVEKALKLAEKSIAVEVITISINGEKL